MIAGDWLTLREAAQALGVSTLTVRRYVKADRLRAEKIDTPAGPTWLVWVDELTPILFGWDAESSAHEQE